MEKLDWEYVDSRDGGYQRAEYRGLVIEAHLDCSPMNPFTDWDCEPPLAARGDRFFTDYSGGEIFNPFAGLRDRWFALHWRALAKAFGESESDYDSECREAAKDWGITLTVARRHIAESRLEDIKPGRDGFGFSDASETIAALWQLRGIEALTAGSNGYCQRDWAELLLVATPSWAEKCGVPRESHAAQLRAAVDLYSAWAWGDVYGFVIKGPGGRDFANAAGALDSCWGFYGSDHGDSGLEEAAIAAADCILAAAAKRKAEKLKTLIRSRVPLERRPAILAEAEAF